MGEPVAPGDIATVPGNKLVFNGPFNASRPDDECFLKVTNTSQKKIGFAVKLKCPEGLQGMEVNPASGALFPGQAVELKVTRHWSGASESGQSGEDRVSIEWANAPPNSGAAPFDFAWFNMDNALVRRKNIPILYND